MLKLGVVAEAIDRIEVEAMPQASVMLKRRLPKTDTLDELSSVATALDWARGAIERLLDASAASPHRLAARKLIPGGGHRQKMGGITLDQASKSLAVALEVVYEAIARLPTGPVRHQAANPYPIELIHRAMQLGSMLSGAEPVPARLKPSVSPTSAFRRVVGICYEAMNEPTADPERALKAFVKGWREESKQMEQQTRGTEPA